MRSPVPPTWNTIGMPASAAAAHTPSRPRWLGEWPGGHPEATEQRGGAHVQRLGGQRRRAVEVAQRHVQRRQQAVVDRAELDHPTVVGPGRADGQLEVARVLPVAQAAVVERVEHELAGEAEQVEGARPVVGDERAGGGEVLAQHDLVGLGRHLLVGVQAGDEPIEGRVQVGSESSACCRSPVWRSSLPPGYRSGAIRSRSAGSAWSRSQFGVSMMWASASCTTSPVELYPIAQSLHPASTCVETPGSGTGRFTFDRASRPSDVAGMMGR